MGCCQSSMAKFASPLVPVPLPSRLDDLWHWQDSQILNALRFVILRLDPKTAERNVAMQDDAEALATKAGQTIGGMHENELLRREMTVISSTPIDLPGLPRNGVRPPASTDEMLPSWWPVSHVLRIDRPLEELRDCILSLQLANKLHEEQARSIVCRGSLCASDQCQRHVSTVDEKQQHKAMRTRGEALVWHFAPVLAQSTVTFAAPADLRRLCVGMLVPLPPSELVRIIKLVGDLDLLSKGFVTIRDISRHIASLSTARFCAASTFPWLLDFVVSRVRGKLRYDEFVWFVHNLCASSDAEVVQVAFGKLATAFRQGDYVLDLDQFETAHRHFVVNNGQPEDMALRSTLLGLRERRRASLSAAEYGDAGRWFHLEDFVRVCKQQPVLLFSLRGARDFFRRRTFGISFWTRRSKQLGKAISSSRTLVPDGTSAVDIAYPRRRVAASWQASKTSATQATLKPEGGRALRSRDDVFAEQLHRQPAFRMRLPRLGPLLHTQSQLLGQPHGQAQERASTAVLPGDAPAVEQLEVFKRLLPPDRLENPPVAAGVARQETPKLPSPQTSRRNTPGPGAESVANLPATTSGQLQIVVPPASAGLTSKPTAQRAPLGRPLAAAAKGKAPPTLSPQASGPPDKHPGMENARTTLVLPATAGLRLISPSAATSHQEPCRPLHQARSAACTADPDQARPHALHVPLPGQVSP